VSGTALTIHHVQQLERLSRNVVLGLDTDKAGINAMKKSADIMLRRGLDVKVARFAEGADPADMVQKDLAGFKTAIKDSVHIIEFLLSHLRRDITDERAYKLKVREEVIPFVTLIPNRIDQEHFEGVIAEALGTTKDAIHFEVLRLIDTQAKVPTSSFEKPETPNMPPAETRDQREKALAYLVAALAIVDEHEAGVIRRCLRQILDTEYEDILGSVDQLLVSKLTFSLEREFEAVAGKVRRDEILHKLNRYRDLVGKEAIQQQRAKLGTVAGEEEAVLLQSIAHHTTMLRRPPYGDDIFTASM
jgi:DNA primase